jgi:cytochrome c biogenesis protein CcmG/thiol:disulfide interchange protein DsbE
MTEEKQVAAEPQEKKKGSIWQYLVWGAVAVLLGLVAIQLVKSQQGTVQAGQEAPNFVLTTFEGQQIDTTQLRGKVILVNFWASWCNPCELEAPDLQAAWEYYEPSGDVVFLGVDWTDTDNEAKEYMEKFGITYPSGPDLGTRISQAFRTTGVPETYIIDQEGTLVYAKFGPFESLAEIQSVIEPLLAQ